MKRILVIGCSGSGKSTFARQFSDITGLPLVILDQHYWQPGWAEPSREEWIKTCTALMEKPSWIMDGSFGSTLELRLQYADTVIFLDRAPWLCLSRVLKRQRQHEGRVRDSMAPGCPEKMDFEFLHYILMFRWISRPGMLKKLEQFKHSGKVVILRSDQAYADFLSEVAAGIPKKS